MTDSFMVVDKKTEELETREWLESLAYVIEHAGPQRTRHLLDDLLDRARQQGVPVPSGVHTQIGRAHV